MEFSTVKKLIYTEERGEEPVFLDRIGDCLFVKHGGFVKDYHFKKNSYNPKNNGSRDLLGVDMKFVKEYYDNENIVFKNLELNLKGKGGKLMICRSNDSHQDNCVLLEINSKRNCQQTKEEKNGERGTFLKVLEGGKICNGDTVRYIE
eukprot:TRINITY_DN226_c0_g1_i1.p1 TRINITY_DN226_c0_g1~~TRINITY_DN226_c0_g1_i1.p1  ORF type:complete len:148 (+),score=18.25 TRINITY_DN226_c0_g1_i1:70-513(+)